MDPAENTHSVVPTLVGVLLTLHALMLAWGAYIHSPVIDEVAYLPAGISHWQTGDFSLAKVNPPLVRLVAALPTLLLKPETDWSELDPDGAVRQTHPMGRKFVRLNGDKTFLLFALARWACIPFSLLAAFVIYRWSSELFGARSGVLAMLLWCISPSVLAHAQLMTPDIGGVACGLLCLYTFRRWLQNLTGRRTLILGLTLGFAELARTTWLVLYPMLFLLTVLLAHRSRLTPALCKLGGAFLVSLVVLNAGYGFGGTLQPIGGIKLKSELLSCRNVEAKSCEKSLMRSLPSPLPLEYVRGFDLQYSHFERGFHAYINGELRSEGVWWYYAYALLLKLPIGTIALGAIVCGLFLVGTLRVSWREEVLLLVPIVAIATLVSSKTGINQHMRYMLPVFPLGIIFMSRLASHSGTFAKRLLYLLVGSIVVESLGQYPHTLSFFNAYTGGPYQARRLLDNSNFDWGQDLFLLRNRIQNHEGPPVKVNYFGNIPPELVGIKRADSFRRGFHYWSEPIDLEKLTPGIYAVSVQSLQIFELMNRHNFTGTRVNFYGWLMDREPDEIVGSTIYVYHLTEQVLKELRMTVGAERGRLR